MRSAISSKPTPRFGATFTSIIAVTPSCPSTRLQLISAEYCTITFSLSSFLTILEVSSNVKSPFLKYYLLKYGYFFLEFLKFLTLFLLRTPCSPPTTIKFFHFFHYIKFKHIFNLKSIPEIEFHFIDCWKLGQTRKKKME